MEAIMDRVEKALEKIRPYLVADGGDISVVDIIGRDGAEGGNERCL